MDRCSIAFWLRQAIGRICDIMLTHRAPSVPSSVACLVITRDREELLLQRSLPSVASQSLRPSVVAVVDDGDSLSSRVVAEIGQLLARDRIEVVHNWRSPGPGGAWNTGLELLWRAGHRGWVALLDDDDAWDPDHLAVNAKAVEETGANVVVSGLRLVAEGRSVARPLVDRLLDVDFLVGNPGWQATNTFVSLEQLLAVGGFREDLPSLNDRDLAIRLLRHPATRWALVPRWTATWHLGTPGALSTAGGAAKLHGLGAFWRIYGDEMEPVARAAFLNRAVRLFGVGEHEIRDAASRYEGSRRERGDLDVYANQ